MKRLKIAYVSIYDARDVNNWSGTGYYMAKTVEKHLGDIDYIDRLPQVNPALLRAKSFVYSRLLGRYYMKDRTPLMGRHYAREVEKRLRGKQYDLIFSPGAIPVAYLETRIPFCFWSDATFHSMLGYQYTNLAGETIRDGIAMEQRALDNCLLACYSSQWAAESAVRHYHVDCDRVRVIPLGANMSEAPDSASCSHAVSTPLRLLFVGKEWDRKGGALAFEALVELERMAIDTRLTIVGCTPPDGYRHGNLQVHPFLDKQRAEDRAVLDGLYRTADFFLLPTRREPYGIVFCEANSYGIPVLATETGGVPTIVRNGENGFLLPLEASGREYAELVARIISDPAGYAALRASSRQRYEQELNWDSAGEALRKAVFEKLDL